MFPHIIFFFFLFFLLCNPNSAINDPQTNLLNIGCSPYNATNSSLFLSNLNTTFSNLRSQISAGNLTAVSDLRRSQPPLFSLFFCRSYLSPLSCLSCLDAAVSISGDHCRSASGGRTVFDGCTLRYESAPFSDQGSVIGNSPVCGNKSSSVLGFADSVTDLIRDLSLADWKIDGFSAAVEREGVFAAAQCADTVEEEVCRECLKVGFINLKRCLPAENGRAVDAGCFMRYSDSRFFLGNQTVDLARFLGGSGIFGMIC